MKTAAALLIMLMTVPAVGARHAKPASSEDAQFRRWLVHYLKNDRHPFNRDLHNLVYGYALVDLNGDRRNEAVVWKSDADMCGTGGCRLDVFVHGTSDWRLLSETKITRPPIMLLGTSNKGWRDLASWQAGGGIKRPYEARVRFNGNEYEAVEPTDWTGVNPRPPRLHGKILIKDATIPLFPNKCHRTEEAPSVFGPIPMKLAKPGSC